MLLKVSTHYRVVHIQGKADEFIEQANAIFNSILRPEVTPPIICYRVKRKNRTRTCHATQWPTKQVKINKCYRSCVPIEETIGVGFMI